MGPQPPAAQAREQRHRLTSLLPGEAHSAPAGLRALLRVQLATEEGKELFTLDRGHRPAAVAALARVLTRTGRLAAVVLEEKGIDEFDEDGRPDCSCPAFRQLLVLPVPLLPCLTGPARGQARCEHFPAALRSTGPRP